MRIRDRIVGLQDSDRSSATQLVCGLHTATPSRSLPEHDTRMSDAMIGKRICREAVTAQRQERRIRVQHGTGNEVVGTEHMLTAYQGAVPVAHEVRAVVT